MSYHTRIPGEGDRAQGRGSNRGGRGGLPPRQAQEGYSPSALGIGSNAIHDASKQVEERPFAWGGGPNGRDRGGQARKRGPSVPGPASVASSSGNHMQSLGTVTSRNNAGGGMQSPGGSQSSRAAPKAAASAASAAPANAATVNTGATLSASKAAESAPAGSSHAPAAPSTESIAASSSVPSTSQLAASSDSGAGAAEHTSAPGQQGGAEGKSGQATSAQTAQGSQSMPPAAQGMGSQQPTQKSQQPGPPSINERGPVPVHKQNGQLQGPRGSPQAQRWGRGQQPGRGSPGRHYHHIQHDRHSNAYLASPPRPAQYGVFGPGSPPMYPGQHPSPQVFGGLQPIPFGTVGAVHYYPQMPASSYVPGPSHHTLHPNAPQFIPSQAYTPAGPSAPPPRTYGAQAVGMPGVPNKHPLPLTPPYASAPARQSGAWQHESPPTTPRLQASSDILRVSGEDPDVPEPKEPKEPEATAEPPSRPKAGEGSAAGAAEPAGGSRQPRAAAPAAGQLGKPAAPAMQDPPSQPEDLPPQPEDPPSHPDTVASNASDASGREAQSEAAATNGGAGTENAPSADTAEQSAGPEPSVQPDAASNHHSRPAPVGEPQAGSAVASDSAGAPQDGPSAAAEEAPLKAEPADASKPLPTPVQAPQDRRAQSRQAPTPCAKAAVLQQKSAMQSSRTAATPQTSALPATAGWARRRMPAPEPQAQAASGPPAAAQPPAQAAQAPTATPAPAAAQPQPPVTAVPPKAETHARDSPSSVAGTIAPEIESASSSTATSKPQELQHRDPPAPAEAVKAQPAPASAPAPEGKSSEASGSQPTIDTKASTAPQQTTAEATPAACSGPASSGQTAREPAKESLPPPQAASQPAAAAAPAGAPAQQAPAEAPKPKTWANMAAKLSEGGSSTAFKPPPKALFSRTLSGASSGISVQSSRGEDGRDRSSRGQSRDPVRPNGQEGQRRGRGGQPAQRLGREERPMGGRGRDGRRNTREAHPDSSAASREREGSSTVLPRAVPAKPPVGRSAVAAPSAASQQTPHQPAPAPGPPQEEAAPVKAKPQPVADAADSSPEQQAESLPASAAFPQISAQIDSNKKPVTETSSAPPKQEASGEAASAAKPKQALAGPPMPLSGPLLTAVQRLCASIGESAAESAGAQPLVPRGLVNTGNLCFMNSILQALMGGKDFCSFLQQLQAASPALSAPELPTLHALSALAAEFQAVTTSAESSGGAADGEKGKKDPEYKVKTDTPKSAWTKPNAQGASGLTLAARLNQQALLPDMMFPTVNRFNPDNGQPLPISNGKTSVSAAAAAAAAANRQQEDAQEFLSFLLDSAHQELLRLKARVSGAPSAAAHGAEKADEGDGEEWLTAGRSKKQKAVTRGTTSLQGGVTPASELFGGALRSEVRAQGAPPSATLEPCFLVHLDIHPENVHSITDALSAFTSPETITGYKVKDHSEAVTARKVVQLFQLPRILVLHLKRFSYTLNGTGKIHKPINYGERLRMQPSWIAELCPEPRHRGGAEYELIAAVLHHGKTPSAGHYTADVRQRDNKWLRFDDADLSYVPVDRVINDTRAYLLFYQLRT